MSQRVISLQGTYVNGLLALSSPYANYPVLCRPDTSDPHVFYQPRYQGAFLYLERCDYGQVTRICRLEYTGTLESWQFAIYKYSDERYDPAEWFFPGAGYVDGTLAARQARRLGIAEERGLMRWAYGAVAGAFSPWEGGRRGRRPRGQRHRDAAPPPDRGRRHASGPPHLASAIPRDLLCHGFE